MVKNRVYKSSSGLILFQVRKHYWWEKHEKILLSGQTLSKITILAMVNFYCLNNIEENPRYSVL